MLKVFLFLILDEFSYLKFTIFIKVVSYYGTRLSFFFFVFYFSAKKVLYRNISIPLWVLPLFFWSKMLELMLSRFYNLLFLSTKWYFTTEIYFLLLICATCFFSFWKRIFLKRLEILTIDVNCWMPLKRFYINIYTT